MLLVRQNEENNLTTNSVCLTVTSVCFNLTSVAVLLAFSPRLAKPAGQFANLQHFFFNLVS